MILKAIARKLINYILSKYTITELKAITHYFCKTVRKTRYKYFEPSNEELKKQSKYLIRIKRSVRDNLTTK